MSVFILIYFPCLQGSGKEREREREREKEREGDRELKCQDDTELKSVTSNDCPCTIIAVALY